MDANTHEGVMIESQKVFPGVILDNGAYAIAEFKKRTGLENKALRSARSRGLVIRQCGSRRFILGRDFLEFLSKEAAGA
jgi:hypothetical protein